MTDKVQKIREWIERKLEVMQYQIHRIDAYKELKSILTYIDFLQKEPVSEELEEAAIRYAKEEYNHKSPATLPDKCRCCYAPLMYAFKAGAKWQKEKDQDTVEIAKKEVIKETTEWLTKHAKKYYFNKDRYLGTDELVEDYKFIMSMDYE